eukprot:365377-Chlamydomonas_euryale.AAC.39
MAGRQAAETGSASRAQQCVVRSWYEHASRRRERAGEGLRGREHSCLEALATRPAHAGARAATYDTTAEHALRVAASRSSRLRALASASRGIGGGVERRRPRTYTTSGSPCCAWDGHACCAPARLSTPPRRGRRVAAPPPGESRLPPRAAMAARRLRLSWRPRCRRTSALSTSLRSSRMTCSTPGLPRAVCGASPGRCAAVSARAAWQRPGSPRAVLAWAAAGRARGRDGGERTGGKLAAWSPQPRNIGWRASGARVANATPNERKTMPPSDCPATDTAGPAGDE